MKSLTEEHKQGLGVAFNEAILLAVELSPKQSLCGITLALLTLPESGPAPEDPRIQRTEGHGIFPGKPDGEQTAAADREDTAAEPKR